jgi:hypothetical protein
VGHLELPDKWRDEDMTESDQLEAFPLERCDYCGPLEWTKERFGQVTHKCKCPHRSDKFCQAHPNGDCKLPVPLTNLPGWTFEDIFP